MPYSQITARYNGFTGAPGWMRMKFSGALTVADANTAAANWRTFLTSMATYAPSGSSITFDSTVGQFSDLGVQTGEVTLSVIPAGVSGISAATYAGGSGAVINWVTNAFHMGRKVRGRTFLVPLTSQAFAADGTLVSTAQTNIQAAGLAFAASTPQPIISSIKTASGGVTSGFVANILGATVPDRSAVLRSRRD
jgi:hypothetical protein